MVENVLLIIVDALRPDRVGAYSGRDLTPNLDKLAKRGRIFERCFSCTNATDPSMTTILTGQYPTRHGILNHGNQVTDTELRMTSGMRTIPHHLGNSYCCVGIDNLYRWHQRGYDKYGTSVAFSNLQNVMQNVSEEIYNIHDKFVNITLFGGSKNNQPYVQAPKITKTVMQSIRELDSPWFIMAHYWDTHLPYVPPNKHPENIAKQSYVDGDQPLNDILNRIDGSEWERRLTDGLLGNSKTVGDMKRKYDAGVRLVDNGISDIVSVLKNQGIYDGTAIIVTADHGESLTEHQIYFDHHGLYDVTVHVPLIIEAPSFSGRDPALVQHYDLAPTILDLLDVSYQPGDFDGLSLFDEENHGIIGDRDTVYMEEHHATHKRAVRTTRYKYIESLNEQTGCRYCSIEHAPRRELYDLVVDPKETTNIVKERSKVADQLSMRMEEWIESRPNPEDGNEIPNFDDENVLRRLKDLGYI